MWTPRVRTADLALTDPFDFTSLTLIERYNKPDTLTITGDLSDISPIVHPGWGVVLVDDDGKQRFSGWATPITRNGDGTGSVTFLGDLTLLWDRICWPTPASAWTSQTTAYDVQTAVHETRILGYIERNAGASAYHSGTDDRRVAHLRLPSSSGRGTSGKTSARFQNLGLLCANLAEAASLRVRIVQTYVGTTPYLDVKIDAAGDESAWARFGDANSGGPAMLGEDWTYTIGAGASVVLGAAAGVGTARNLTMARDATRETAWTRRVEYFLDQSGMTDAGEVADSVANAMAENAPTVDISAPIIAGDLTFGNTASDVPIGAKVGVELDGDLIIERVRQVTTTVQVADDAETVFVEPLVGSPDIGLTSDQKLLRRALQRLRNLESQ